MLNYQRVTGIKNDKHVIPAIIDFALIWTLNSLRAMARTAAQESSKRSCKGNTACNRGFPHGGCFGFWGRTEEPPPKSTNWMQDLHHCSPWFTILHLQPIYMASQPSVWWVSLEPVRCCGLHERCCPHTRTQCSANSMSAFELILRWFGAKKSESKFLSPTCHHLNKN